MQKFFRWFKGPYFIVTFSVILSVISEALELKYNIVNPFVTGVIFSFLGIVIGMLLETVRNTILFYDRISAVIERIKAVTTEISIPAIGIQKMMVTIVEEFDKVFNASTRLLNLKVSPSFKGNTKLPCSICKTNHESSNGNCTNCKLPAEVWAGFNE